MCKLLTLAATLAALAAPAATAASAAPAAPAGPVARSAAGGLGVLQPCRLRGVEHEARCGVVVRPLDPTRADGPTIEVHFAVLPALARRKLPDPVFFFAGGPGQSAIELAGPIGRLLARLGNRRDLVLIDQRGTGRSAPLLCDAPAPTAPLAELADPARQRAALQRCRERLQTLPHGDLRQYTTTIAIDDAEAVRQALGAPQVDLVGASYGTRAALEYLRRYPQALRRIVLDGVAPPDMALPAAFAIDAQAAFDALAAACAAEAACAARHPDLRARWREVVAGLPREVALAHPVTGVEERLVLTRDVAVSLLRLPLYAPVLASALPLAIDEAAAGRFAALAGLATAMTGRRGTLDLAEGMHFSVVCAEDLPRMRAAAGGDAAPEAAAPPAAPPAAPDFGDTLARLYLDTCANWPRAAVPADFYALRSSPVPALLLSGGIDPVTPPRHGARVAQALGANARHVVVPNAGHGVLAIGCTRDIVYRFVDAVTDAEALAVDAGCVERIPRPPAFQPVRAPAAEGAR
ncbi:MAG: alpha/beta fold hydrolase [Burkholderiales bacterium]|nr:alpha/beta fold hydrolase [Burkholderiales bacterium]